MSEGRLQPGDGREALDRVDRLSMVEAARWLDLHPFELARIVGHLGGYPEDMRFSLDEVDRIRGAVGIETWWQPGLMLPPDDGGRDRALLSGVAKRLLDRGATRAGGVRADNLLRGLDAEDRRRVRRLINELIRSGMLDSESSWRGLRVCISAEYVDAMQTIADEDDAAAPGL